jgi:hypothetical protein
MTLVCAPPHRKTIAVAGAPTVLRVQGDAALEPGAKMPECEDRVAEVSNVLDTCLELLEGGVHVRPPLPEALVTVVGVVASTCAVNGYHSASGCQISSITSMSRRL